MLKQPALALKYQPIALEALERSNSRENSCHRPTDEFAQLQPKILVESLARSPMEQVQKINLGAANNALNNLEQPEAAHKSRGA